MDVSYNEFHICRKVRDLCGFSDSLYSSSGNVIFSDFKAVQTFQTKLNELFDARNEKEKRVSAGSINAMGLIDEIFHYVCMLFRRDKAPKAFTNLLVDLDESFGKDKIDRLLSDFMEEFPPTEVYKGNLSKEEYLAKTAYDEGTKKERSNREQVLEELVMLHLANENPAFHPFAILFDEFNLKKDPNYVKTWNQIKAYFLTQPVFGPKNNDLITMLKEPVNASPTSLKGQLDYIRTYWGYLLDSFMKRRLLESMDTISEEEKAAWHPVTGGEVELSPYSYDDLMREYEKFTPDKDWMPKVVLMAKTVLVWLYQLSKKYNRDINRLDQIPDEELDALRDQGFTGLWLIGLWERSYASKRIKQINGNPEAAASAYSLLDYEIAWNLGGWDALENLRKRCWIRGIRLASDMVPNHTGMDGNWVVEHPDYFITSRDCPFPQYTFTGENLSRDGRVSIYLEDHYYSKTDCAVCFKRVDNYTGDTVYIYHGNDGTGMPWNDTAQIDFLNPTAREAVIQQIMKVAANFPIIRFDAAMVLAKKHIRRLWYPEPGHGGDIASRSRYALTSGEFEERIPNEFWREVVDRCAAQMPDTLLLAEAFWMMEGYFTRTLGMHRVYNSAFMNMLKKEENQKYRDTVKNTIKFDPQVLKRFVNFMNNPDEETAVAQFGKGDKYFGVCTLMITMPGLPMFGHGQIEGFEEKYGMEYMKAYRDEVPDSGLVDRHWHDIFPIMHKRYLFSGVDNFLFYDVWNNGVVNENVFAYSNGTDEEKTIVFYNNKYEQAAGWIKLSCEYAVKTGNGENDKKMVTRTLSEGLGLTSGGDHFCIFKEHKSGLWYVRKSDDIINQGMYVCLNGFESQVYVDLKQVEDTAEGKYAKLHELLAGKGVPDLDIAWEEYRYRDLYAVLEKFVSEEYIKNISLYFATKEQLKELATFDATSEDEEIELPKRPSVKEILSSVKEAALSYYEKEIEFESLEMAETAKELTENTEDKRTTKKTSSAKSAKNPKVLTAAQRFTAFSKQIEFLCQCKDGETEYEKTIAEGLETIKYAPLVLACFAAVSSCGCKNAIKWGYYRKLTEYLARASVKDSGFKTLFEIIFRLQVVGSMSFTATGYKVTANKVADELCTGKDSFAYTGSHGWDGVRWFNKERMDMTLWYLLSSVCLVSAKTTRTGVYKLYSDFTLAKDKAEYKCEKFVKPFELPKKAVKKTSLKKPAEKSATEKSAKKVKDSAVEDKKKTTKKKSSKSKNTDDSVSKN